MSRRSYTDLADELEAADAKWRHQIITHVKSGEKYMICRCYFRESDMALSILYSPILASGRRVPFGRTVEEMGFGTRFVFIGGLIK